MSFSCLSVVRLCDAFISIGSHGRFASHWANVPSNKLHLLNLKQEKLFGSSISRCDFCWHSCQRHNRSPSFLLRVGTNNHSRQKSLFAHWFRLRPRHGHHRRRLPHGESVNLSWVENRNLIILDGKFLQNCCCFRRTENPLHLKVKLLSSFYSLNILKYELIKQY